MNFSLITVRFRGSSKKERESENDCCLAHTRVTSQLNIVGFSVTSATNRLTAEDGNSIFSPSQRSLPPSDRLSVCLFPFRCGFYSRRNHHYRK